MGPEERAARAQDRIMAYLDLLEDKIGHFRETVRRVEARHACTDEFLCQSSELPRPGESFTYRVCGISSEIVKSSLARA
jgi:hypothetical protein